MQYYATWREVCCDKSKASNVVLLCLCGPAEHSNLIPGFWEFHNKVGYDLGTVASCSSCEGN